MALSLSEAVAAVRRVIEHPYTTAVGERARLGTLAHALQKSRLPVVEVAGAVGAKEHLARRRWLNFVRWVQGRRSQWLKDNNIKVERAEQSDREESSNDGET